MAHRYKDPYSGKIKSNRHFRKQKGRKKLEYIYSIGGDQWFPWPVHWSDYKWDDKAYRNLPTKNAFLKRNWRPVKLSKVIKKICHRKNRRYMKSEDLTNYTYNKNTDFWWQLW